jgi:hypothetical protein
MKLRKQGRYLAGLLAAVLILGLSTTVLAYETWSDSFSFTVTTTKRDQTTGKLVKTTNTVTGTVNMYIVPDGPPAIGPNGYYLEFIDSHDGLVVGIEGLEIVSTKIPKSKSKKIMGVGAGVFCHNGTPAGPAYLSMTGTVALDAPDGTPTSITATLTMGGGEQRNGDNSIWSGKPKLVLKK